MDLLNVVIRADTSGSDKAETSLEQMTGAARGADAAVNSLGRSSSSAGAGIGVVASASDKAAASTKMYAAALAAQAQAARVEGAANDNLRLNTANIAAQFQDIGVTAAMGMNPLMIALQQGTQLSAVFSAQSGGVLKTLGAAFASVLSPISLVTIAVVALAAAGMQMVDWGNAAEFVLNKLADVLVPIAPYAAAATAGLALLYSPAIIMGVVSVVAALGRLAAQAVVTAATMAMANPGAALILGLAAAATAAVIFREDLARIFGRDIVADAQQGINWIIGAFVGGFNGVRATWAMLPAAIGDIVIQAANSTIGGVESLLQNVTGKINEFIRNINGAIAMIPENLRGGWTGIGEIGNVSFGRVANPNAGAASAVSGVIGSEMSAAMGQDYVGELVSMVQKGASGAADALRGLATAAGAAGTEADKAGKKAANEAEKLAEAYGKIVAGAEEFITKQENERQALGMSEQQANALRYSFELLNKAREAGIELTPEQVSELNGLGREMAAAEAETKRLTKAFDDQKKMVDDVLGTIGGAFSGLFDGTIKDFDGFIDHLVSGFAKLGQANIEKLFTADGLGSLFNGNPTAANDNAGGSTSIFDTLFQATKKGTQEGSATGIFSGIKGLQGLSGMASAGLGGFGIGAQTQNPLMGGLGGALSGFAAGGPVGAVIGGIAGIVGGLFGMNQALKEARAKLAQVRPAIEQFIDAMNGEVISQYSKALADANRQAKEYIDLAKKAKDNNLVKEIEAALANLPNTLARQYEKDVQASINALQGEGWLNDVAAAQEQYNARLKDAAMLGVSADAALTEFTLNLAEIAKEGDLTADQMAKLLAMFPQFAVMLKDVAGTDLKALQSNVDQARSNLEAAYQRERSALEGVIGTWKQLGDQLRKFRDGLRLNDQFSPLSPSDKLAEAQRQFADVSARALAGDQQAMGELTSVSQEYLDAARGYYASSEQYFAIFGNVEAILDQALGKAETQVSAAEKQLIALDKQVATLIDINGGVMDVAQAIRNLQAALNAQKAAGGFDAKTYWSGDQKALYGEIQSYKEQTGASSVPIANFWNQLWSAGSASAMDEIARRLRAEVDALTPNSSSMMNMSSYSSPAVSRMSVTPTFAANSNSSDSSALLAELRALRAEVAVLREASVEGSKAVVGAVGGVKAEMATGNRENSLRPTSRGKAA